MKFDIFCEIQKAKPWPKNHEAVLLRETLEQAEAADKAGFDTWWQVEHHAATILPGMPPITMSIAGSILNIMPAPPRPRGA